MSEELKVCPFCGGEATMNERLRDGYRFVECESCAFGLCAERTKAEAITAWNTRADFPGITDPAAFVQAARGCVEALEAILHAVCHDTGFAAAVRADSGVAYPWEALDISEEQSRAALTAFCAATGEKM